MKHVWVVFLTLAYEGHKVGSAPICAHRQAGCHALSLADLFDRVIQQSTRMHGFSSDLHSEFEQYFLPMKNHIGKQKCHTFHILTPDDKENTQRLAREELTEVILKLLGAWGDPLSQLHHSMAQGQAQAQHQDQEFNHYSSNKALEMSDMLQELQNGVERVAEKMQLLGVTSNSLSDLSSSEALAPPPSSSSSSSSSSERDPMDHQYLLYCFRRDSNKVQSYLRILKCTILPEQGC